MGRSVSYANGSEVVIYSYVDNVFDDDGNFDEFESQFVFDCALEYLKDASIEAFPSLTVADEWLGREDHAILENQLVYIGLSEYCGLVSVWVVPKEDEHYAFGVAFANKIEAKLKNIVDNAFGVILNKTAQFSNGEALFSQAA